MIVATLTHDGTTAVQTVEDAFDLLRAAYIGTKYTFELREMTEEEFEKLVEFEGF